MIEIKHLKKEYEEATPLKDVNAVINDGDIIAIIGPSGTGKSTLMRCINQLEKPTSGEIIFNGKVITDPKCKINKVRQKMGMVFQSFNLFPHLTVLENIMLAPVDILGKSKQEAYEKAMELLNAVGLSDKALQYPDQLSGGQKQRVSIARTLAMDPEVILLDEPTSALDPTMVREVENVILNLAKLGKTMMIVTHEMRLAKAISNRVFYMDNGELYEDGTPDEIFNNPKRERTKAFIKQLKVLKQKFNTSDFKYERFFENFNSFVANCDASEEQIIKARALLEKISSDIIPHYSDKSLKFNILTEYNPEIIKLNMIFYYSTDGIDENIITAELKNVIEKYSSDLSAEKIEDEDYTYKISCTV